MKTIDDIRRVDLWEGVPPGEMAERFRNWQDERIRGILGPDRLRAFARVRDTSDSPSNDRSGG